MRKVFIERKTKQGMETQERRIDANGFAFISSNPIEPYAYPSNSRYRSLISTDVSQMDTTKQLDLTIL